DDGCHRRLSALWLSRSGEHAPALRDGIDLGFVALARAERITVVVVRANVPVAIPCVGFDSVPVTLRDREEIVVRSRIAARCADLGEALQRRDEEPSEPDAHSLPSDPDPAVPAVPVATSDQR